VSAYDPDEWHDLAVAAAGAAAALTGLLFVAVSINLRRILKYAWLPGRAAGTLGLLLTLLLVSLFMLVPGQSGRTLGIEIALTGIVLAVGVVRWSHGRGPTSEAWSIRAVTALSLLLVPAAALVAGGVSLGVDGGGGLYWVLGGLVLGFAGAVTNAWVLLVEIER
jgi:modulator of FtsH protease